MKLKKKYFIKIAIILCAYLFSSNFLLAQQENIPSEDMQEVGVFAPKQETDIPSNNIIEKQKELEQQHQELSKDIASFKKKLKKSKTEAIILKTTGYFKPSINTELKKIQKKTESFSNQIITEISDKNTSNIPYKIKSKYIEQLAKMHEDIKNQSDDLNKTALKKLKSYKI